MIPRDSIEKFKMRWFIKNYAGKVVTAFYASKGMVLKSQEEQK